MNGSEIFESLGSFFAMKDHTPSDLSVQFPEMELPCSLSVILYRLS